MATTRTRTTTKKPRARSRVQVEQDLEELSEEVRSAEPVDRRSAAIEASRREEIREAVKDLSVETIVSQTTGLSVEISRMLSRINELLVEKVHQMEELQNAVTNERREIERLHQIDTVATAVDLLLDEHAKKTIELTREAEEARAAWAAEEALKAKLRKEEEAALALARQREKDEYEYKKRQERARADDEWNAKVQLAERAAAERQRALTKDWEERESALAAREGELVALRKQVEGFDERLRLEIEKAVGAATSSLRGEMETAHRLRIKDMETDKRIADARIVSLEESVTRQSRQIEHLQTQLDAAKQQVQDIAIKAIEGASKRDALDQVMQVTRDREPGVTRSKS